MESENFYIVYVKTNSNGYITAANSSAFLTDTTGWMEIDSGYGDKYHHAQGNYFDGGLYTIDGICRYVWEKNTYRLRTEEEMEADRPKPIPSTDDVLNALLGVIV